jgi:hypothetical protein
MRLEPVYIPGPETPTAPVPAPTRRAFLAGGGLFALGTLVGGACGYTVGATAGRQEAGGEPGAKSPSTGDARLEALRWLAVEAPIEELVRKWNPWFSDFSFDYEKDEVLWKGLDRLAIWCTQNIATADTELLTSLAMMSQIDWRDGETTLQRHYPSIHAERRRRMRGR